MDHADRLQRTLAAFDAANAADPNRELDGTREVAKELLYAQRMSAELAQFAPQASEELQLAARAQHIERWLSPRSAYPEGRSGYKKWRANLSLFHARRAGEIMADQGYPEASIARVQYLIQKRQLKRDDETQTLEDVICLVFLKYYFGDFAAKHDEDKLINIIQLTWNKMSDKGHEHALRLSLPPELAALVGKALA